MFVSASILVSMMVVLLLSLPLTLLVITAVKVVVTVVVRLFEINETGLTEHLLETITYILRNELAYRWLILCLRLTITFSIVCLFFKLSWLLA